MLPNPLNRMPRKHRVWCLLICGTGLYFFANVQRVAIPGSIFNVLQEELDASAPYITALGSSFMYIYALCQLGIGLLVDRYGGGRVIAVGAILFCGGSLMFPLSHTLFMLYFSRAVVGLGASTLYLSLVRETMRSFNRNFPIMLSIVVLIGYTGGIVANAPFVLCVNWLGWRVVMIAAALLSLAFYLLFLLAKSTLRMPKVNPVPFSVTPFRAVLKKRHNIHLFIFCGLNFGLYYVLQTVIGKKFLEDFCGINSDLAAGVLSIMGIVSAVSGLAFAILSRMLGNRRRVFIRFIGVNCVLTIALITILVMLEIRTGWLAVLFCWLSFTASTAAIAVPLLRETNVSEFAGISVSVMNFTCFMFVAMLGNAVGFLMDIFPPTLSDGVQIYSPHSYLAVFGAMLLLSVIVVFCSFRLRETMGKNIADAIS